jgi:uncharacterized membrane protein YqhA
MKTLFGVSRYLVLIAVVGLLLAGAAAMVFAGITTVTVLAEVFAEGAFNAEGARALSLELIELIDVFLLATVILITAIGLYQLFLDPHVELPEWLSVSNLEQLKANLVAVVIVMLAILFLGAVAGRRGEEAAVLDLGAGIGLVVLSVSAAIMAFVRVERNKAAHVEHLHQTAHATHEAATHASVEHKGAKDRA